jgi:hypothetical protein
MPDDEDQSDDATDIVLLDPTTYARDAVTVVNAHLTESFEQIAQTARAMDLAIAQAGALSLPRFRVVTERNSHVESTSPRSAIAKPEVSASVVTTVSSSVAAAESAPASSPSVPMLEAPAPDWPDAPMAADLPKKLSGQTRKILGLWIQMGKPKPTNAVMNEIASQVFLTKFAKTKEGSKARNNFRGRIRIAISRYGSVAEQL